MPGLTVDALACGLPGDELLGVLEGLGVHGTFSLRRAINDGLWLSRFDSEKVVFGGSWMEQNSWL